MWKRFLLAALLIAALAGTATATVALNRLTDLAAEVFPTLSHIKAPKGLITPEYDGGPQTFLVLGSDRRAHARDALDRQNPPHSDTLLLVRFVATDGDVSRGEEAHHLVEYVLYELQCLLVGFQQPGTDPPVRPHGRALAGHAEPWIRGHRRL